MLEIELNNHEYNYLCQASFLASAHKNTISSIIKKDDRYSLKISEEEADEIRDLCGEQLQLVGFDENYELTFEGKILESLIDKFYTD